MFYPGPKGFPFLLCSLFPEVNVAYQQQGLKVAAKKLLQKMQSVQDSWITWANSQGITAVLGLWME
jgi:hypothetical protein